MIKKFLFSLIALIGFVAFTPSADATILYSQMGIEDDIIVYDTVYKNTTYAPQESGTENFAPTGTYQHFYTTTAEVKYIRFQVESHNMTSCYHMSESSHNGSNVFLTPWVAPYVYGFKVNSGVTDGNYCTFEFDTPIPSGKILGAIGLNFNGGAITLKGSTSNSGISYNGDNIYQGTGGFAFQLCDSGGCGEFYVEPTCSDGIQNQDETGVDMGGVCNTSDLDFSLPELGHNYGNTVTFEGTFTNTINANNVYLWLVPRDENLDSIGKLVPISGTSGSFETTIDVADGIWDWTARLYNSRNYTFGDWFPSPSSNTYYFTVGELYVTPQEECATFDLICYFKNGVSWFFIPSQESIDNFENLTLENSLPFSYLYDMGNLYDDAFNQNAEDIDISIDFLGNELTLLSTDKLQAVPFQGLVRTILGAIMIFGTVMFVYKKAIHIYGAEVETTKES